MTPPPTPPMSMREAAERVVRRLQQAGHAAYFAGGCVRDMVLHRSPDDYDVATSARPEEVVALFRRTQQVGAKFGVVLVRIGRQVVETATFRADLDYQDGRHPEGVRFTDAREDAARRDFTINGIFFDPVRGEIVDYVDGRADIERRVIRAIGDPRRRFDEDHLRILRAVRFSARLGFEIEPKTWAAMIEMVPCLTRISPERIREELEAILTHPTRRAGFELLCEARAIDHLWPQAARLATHLEAVARLLGALAEQASFELALAAVLHRLPAAEVVLACRQLRCSNHTQRRAKWLVDRQEVLLRPESLALADLKLLMAAPGFAELLAFHEAKVSAERHSPELVAAVRTRIAAIPPSEVSPPPLIDGTDLEQLGLPKGPAYQTILRRLYYAQLNGTLVDRSEAKSVAARMVREASDIGH